MPGSQRTMRPDMFYPPACSVYAVINERGRIEIRPRTFGWRMRLRQSTTAAQGGRDCGVPRCGTWPSGLFPHGGKTVAACGRCSNPGPLGFSSLLGWRRGRDSNPRYPFRGTLAFQASPFDRSGTSPILWAADTRRMRMLPGPRRFGKGGFPRYTSLSTRSGSPRPVRAWILTAASPSPRVGPRFRMTTGIPASADFRTN